VVSDLRLKGAPRPRFWRIVEIRSAVVCPLSTRYFTFSKSPGFDLRDQMKIEAVLFARSEALTTLMAPLGPASWALDYLVSTC